MATKYITYKQFIRQSARIDAIKNNGIELVYRRNKIKLAVGTVCLIIAVIPNGLGVVMYPLAFSLLISGGIDIYSIIRTQKHKFGFLLWRVRGLIKDGK